MRKAFLSFRDKVLHNFCWIENGIKGIFRLLLLENTKNFQSKKCKNSNQLKLINFLKNETHKVNFTTYVDKTRKKIHSWEFADFNLNKNSVHVEKKSIPRLKLFIFSWNVKKALQAFTPLFNWRKFLKQFNEATLAI